MMECTWVVPTALRVPGPVFGEGLGQELVAQHQGQLEGGGRARGPVDLDEGAEHARLAVDEALAGLVLQAQGFEAGLVPARFGGPQIEDAADAALGQLRRLAVAAEGGQGVEGVEALAQVVGTEGDQGAADLRAVEGQRRRPRVGEQGRVPVAAHRLLVDLDAGGVLGLQQGVQVAAGHV